MDAVKVIKKSGAPGAVPAVTAYVDEPLLPKVSAEDAGKVIGVDENGELDAVTISVPSIPTPAPSDSGKVLGVNNSGAYALQDPGGGGSSVVPKMIRIQLSAANEANVTHFYVNNVDTDYTTFLTDEGAAILSSSVVTVAIGNNAQHRVCGNFYKPSDGLLLSAGVCYYLNIDDEAVIRAYDLGISSVSGTSYVQFIDQP